MKNSRSRGSLFAALLVVVAGTITATAAWAARYSKRPISVTIKGLPQGGYSFDLFRTGDARPTQSSKRFDSPGAQTWTTNEVPTNNRYFIRLHVYQDEGQNKQPADFNLDENASSKTYSVSYTFSSM